MMLHSKHWASSGCAGHGWWWGTKGQTDGALTHFPLEGRSPPCPRQGMSLTCYYVSRHTRTKLVARHPCPRRGQQAALPLKCPGSPCLNPNPLMGITVNIPLPAEVRHTGGGQGLLGTVLWLQLAESRQEKTSAGRRAQARTGTEKVRRGLHGWEEQFNEVCDYLSMANTISEGQQEGSFLGLCC